MIRFLTRQKRRWFYLIVSKISTEFLNPLCFAYAISFRFFFFCTRFTAQGLFTQHVATRIKSMHNFAGYRQVGEIELVHACRPPKLQDKLT